MIVAVVSWMQIGCLGCTDGAVEGLALRCLGRMSKANRSAVLSVEKWGSVS